jgi:ribonuclease P protein component
MRLTRRRDFSRVYREGARARGGALLVVAAPNESSATRLGLSVGRSIWKRAVHRNRTKRILREAFRLEYRSLPKGFDLIVIPTRAAQHLALESSREELAQLAHRACRTTQRKNRAGQESAGRRP